MMKKESFKKVFTGLVAFAMLFAASISAYTATKRNYSEPLSVVDDETVYALLDPSGKVLKATVVDWIRAVGNGNLVVEDVKPEKSITPLKNTPEPEIVDGKLRFKITSRGFRDIYYETDINKELPLEVKIEYELDGKKVRPESLPGKDGHLKVTISIRNKLKKKVQIDFNDADGQLISKEKEIYVPLFVVATLNLDASKFNNLKVEKGWISAQGSYFSLSWFAFPQGQEEISFEADALDIEIPSIIISAMPRLPQGASLEIKEQFKHLYDGLTGLSRLSGAHAVILGNMSEGLSRGDLKDIGKADDGFTVLLKGLEQTSGALRKLSGLVYYQARFIDEIVNSIDTGELRDLDKLNYALSQLKSGISSTSDALFQISAALEGYSYALLQLKQSNQAGINEVESLEGEASCSISFSNLKEILKQQENIISVLLEGGSTHDGQQVPPVSEVVQVTHNLAESLKQIAIQLDLLTQQTSQLNQVPARLEQLKMTLKVLKEGGNIDGNYLPGLSTVNESLDRISGAVYQMKEGVGSSLEKLSALENLSDALMQLRTSIELVLNGGYIGNTKLPGIISSQQYSEKMAYGIATGFKKMQEGEALQKALKEEARKYDTFLGRTRKPNYSGRVRFIIKVQEISKK